MMIEQILKKNGINYVREYSFPDLKSSKGKFLRWDFAVFDDEGDLDFLIEYQGRQHYEPVSVFGGKQGYLRQKYNDERKRKYCRRNGINLVEIPYWDEPLLSYTYIMERAGY